jgi:hypothetical protein
VVDAEDAPQNAGEPPQDGEDGEDEIDADEDEDEEAVEPETEEDDGDDYTGELGVNMSSAILTFLC